MELQQLLHMVGGEGESSYAANSAFGKTVISKAKPILLKSIRELFVDPLPHCITIADLGCSSGTSSLLVISDVINTITAPHQGLSHPLPEFQVFLNDLSGNDFNTLFKHIPFFYDQLRKVEGEDSPSCFFAGVPGSFHGRLFPLNALSFVHSSTSLHWLSQVPKGVESNKYNIYIAKTSPHCVVEAYMKQFDSDFSSFLRSRSKEVISGGKMVLTMIGRKAPDPINKECNQLWELLARSLSDMVSLGHVEEAKLHRFNLPLYHPNGAEITKIVTVEGSFHLGLVETFDVNWEGDDAPENQDLVFDDIKSGRTVANNIRAVMEPLLANHFGKEIIEELFSRYAKHVSEQLMIEKIKYVNLVMSMTKKD